MAPARVLGRERQRLSHARIEDAAVSTFALFTRASLTLSSLQVRPELVMTQGSDTLMLIVNVADFASAEALSEALRDQGFDVDVLEQRARDDSDGVRMELRLRPGGGA